MIPKIGTKLLISIVASALLLGLLVYEGTKVNVTLILDGKEQVLRTHAQTVEKLLIGQKIDMSSKDKIKPALDAEIVHEMTVSWIPAKKVTLLLDGNEKTIWTTGQTVQDVIDEHNFNINKYDKITPGLETKVNKNMKIKVKNAFPITLKVGGKKQDAWTTSTTVADFLKQHDIQLNKLDRVKPGLSETINKKTVVNVTRVEKVTDVVEEPVNYAVVTRRDSDLTAGNERVIEPGEKGLVKNYYEVTLENGKEVSRELIKSEKLKESKDRIVAVGTKQLDAQVARGGGTVSTEMYMKATAYTAYCKGCSGITRTGINLRENPHLKVVAVDPNVIPLGSKVWVEGYGYAIAGDTGGAIDGNRIDLFIPNEQTVKKFGYQTVRVKVYKKGNE